jgi:threonine dehydrogenase-like Zn-dependent dehydrogenase
MLRHGELFLDMVADGDMDVGPLVSHRACYTDAPRLYRMLLQDRAQAMGVVLDWSR